MSRLEAVHGVIAMLLVGSISSCQGMTRHVKTVPTETIQKSIDECVQTTGEKGCKKLCDEVFAERGLARCTVEAKGEVTDVWYEAPTTPEPDPEAQGCAGGRRPEGLVCAPLRATGPIAAYFAWATQMEAASVTAFARIHRTMTNLGAEETLLARIRVAMAEEVMHAHAMAALARRYGAQVRAPEIADASEMTVLDHAIENAIEGCVAEAVAAIHAAFVAAHSPDVEVRAVFSRIAVEETEHALLSYDLASVYAKHLDADGRARVGAAYRAAVTAPKYRVLPPALLALHVPDDGRVAAAIDHALAELAARLNLEQPSC
ncbi:MAG: hypothetical protein ACKV2T_22345 [Kofleriaceae bacterium]